MWHIHMNGVHEGIRSGYSRAWVVNRAEHPIENWRFGAASLTTNHLFLPPSVLSILAVDLALRI
jgi:hypothetical protein